MPDWISPAQAAADFNLSLPILQALRTAGTGCAFIKIGHKTIRYRRSDMEAWMRDYGNTAGTLPASTSQAIADAASRLGTLQASAESIAILTPGGAAIPGAKALAADLWREVDALRTMAGEGKAS